MLELKRRTALLVTGTPGTGKTTISRPLARLLNADYLDPTTLLTREGLNYTYDENRGTRIVSLPRLRSSLNSLARGAARGLVLDSHVCFKIGPSPRLARAIVLRCNPAVLERRLRQKHWSKRKISENVLAEILDICLWNSVKNYGWERTSEIDTTNKRPAQVVQLTIRALRERKIQKQPKVNWLSALNRRGILGHYLREVRT